MTPFTIWCRHCKQAIVIVGPCEGNAWRWTSQCKHGKTAYIAMLAEDLDRIVNATWEESDSNV